MIAHVVLFRPRGDLSPAGRNALAEAFETALREIPSIRRARVGMRVLHARGYEALMHVDYQYAAVLEFDDAAGLTAYLEHPAHQRLASQFFEVSEHALMYDFDLKEGTAGLAGLLGATH
jgi:stress responsive alpha/beta barrel protein